VVEKQAITNKEYQELFTISKRTATSDLSDLVNKGIFKKTGTGKRDLRYKLR
jgi:predicted HTH transcriptional regulator